MGYGVRKLYNVDDEESGAKGKNYDGCRNVCSCIESQQ